MGVTGEYLRFPTYCFLSKPDPSKTTGIENRGQISSFFTFYKIKGRVDSISK